MLDIWYTLIMKYSKIIILFSLALALALVLVVFLLVLKHGSVQNLFKSYSYENKEYKFAVNFPGTALNQHPGPAVPGITSFTFATPFDPQNPETTKGLEEKDLFYFKVEVALYEKGGLLESLFSLNEDPDLLNADSVTIRGTMFEHYVSEISWDPMLQFHFFYTHKGNFSYFITTYDPETLNQFYLED